MKIFQKHFLYILTLSAAAAGIIVVFITPQREITTFVAHMAVFLAFGLVILQIVEKDILKDFSRISKALELLPEKQKKAKKTGRKLSDFDTGVVYSIRELSERISIQMKDTERERNQLKSILESMREGVVVISNDEKLLLINDTAREMFSITDPLLGRPYMETIRNTGLQNIISHTRKKNKSVTQEIPVFFPEERSYLASIRVSSRYKETIVVIFDITELKKLERMKADFVANVSHELRTPLTSIKGYIETLMDRNYDSQEEKKNFLQIINENTDRLIVIASDLLVLSEIESRNLDSEEERKGYGEIDIGETIRHCADSLNSFALKKEISLSVRVQDNLPAFNANKFLLERMLLNLIENAVKYTPEGGSISLSVLCPYENSLQIEITDTGIGIPAEHQERIFERFYRVDKDRSRELGGSGLGLSIVKHAVLQHGGSVEVKSSEGEGSTFTVNLPLY